MKEFGYCIWLVSNDDNWHYPNKGFRTHLTIKSNLTLNDAKNFYKLLQKNPVVLKINSDLKKSVSDDFYALYYNVVFKNNKPFWWPNDAHVSFKYKYNNDFSNEDKNFKIKNQECLFNDIIIMNCNDHYSKWHQVKN